MKFPAYRINVISESAFTVQGHGVHTAFQEHVNALKKYTKCDVATNTSRAADITHIHTVGPYSLWKRLTARHATVVSAHLTADSFVGSLVGAKYWYGLASWYLRWFYNRFTAVLAVSQEVKDDITRLGVKRPIYVVPNTIETSQFQSTPQLKAAARQELGLPPNAFVVIGSGQVQPRKRVDVFMEVAKALPGVSMIWVGGLPFKQLAASSAAMSDMMQHHPDNVIFTGIVKHEAMHRYYQAADLFFLPSDQETFGIVIVEAAASGLPVLLRDISQYRDTFGDGYASGTDDTFAGIIAQFRDDGIYREHWSGRAADIAGRYDAQAGIQHLMDIYAQVIHDYARRHKT